MKRFLAIGGGILALVLAWVLFPRGDGNPANRRGAGESTAERRTLRWGGGVSANADPELSAGRSGAEAEARVEGRVVDALDGHPLPGATVTLRTAGGEETDVTSTDGDGRFTFDRVAGAAVVAAAAPGYAFQAHRIRTDRELLIELDGAVVVSGVVVGPRGAPVEGAEVWVEDLERRWGHPPAAFETVNTGNDGRFVVEHAPMGNLVVHAEHPHHLSGRLAIGGLGPGRVKDEVRIELGEAAVVEGVVRNAAGATVAGAAVTWRDRPGDWREPDDAISATADAEGRFVLRNVPPGEGAVQATSTDGALGGSDAEAEAGRTTRVDVSLESGGDVSGFVVDDSGNPVPGARVRLDADVGADRGWWELRGSRAGDHARARGRTETVTGADGGFTLSIPHSRSRWLVAEAGILKGYAHSKAGATDVRIRVTATGILRYRLVEADGQAPFTGLAQVSAFHLDFGGRILQVAHDDATGEGVLQGKPGGWLISIPYAEDRLDDTKKIAVEVAAAPPEVRMDLAVGARKDALEARVVGRVVGPDGDAVRGAHVSLMRGMREEHSGGELDWRGSVRSGPTGRFALPAPSGSHRLFVYHPEFRTELVNVFVARAGDVDAGIIRLAVGTGAAAVYEFSGIGAVLSTDEVRGCIVRSVIGGGPAERAGVRGGDAILEVDGAPVHGMSLDDVVERIRGPVGSFVRLRLEREGNFQPFVIDVVREKIRT